MNCNAKRDKIAQHSEKIHLANITPNLTISHTVFHAVMAAFAAHGTLWHEAHGLATFIES